MATIVLISCGSKKLPHRAAAKDLYISSLFRLSRRYAQTLGAEKIFILSAKHGLLGLNEVIEPYDLTLNKMSIKQRQQWADKVLRELNEVTDLSGDHFIFLAGKKYRENLIPSTKSSEIPLEGLRIGEQLKYLKQKGIPPEGQMLY